MNQKGFAHLLLLVLLVAGLAIGLYLVTQTQIFRSRANSEFITFSGTSVKTVNNKLTTSSLTVNVTLKTPFQNLKANAVSSTPTRRAYQVIIGKDGKSIYQRDCEMKENQSPWALGDGFATNTTCPWVKLGGYVIPAGTKGFYTNISTTVFVEQDNTQRYVQYLAVDDKTYYRRCNLNPSNGIENVFDGFQNNSLCKWELYDKSKAGVEYNLTIYNGSQYNQLKNAQIRTTNNRSFAFRNCLQSEVRYPYLGDENNCPWSQEYPLDQDPVSLSNLNGGTQVNNVLGYERDGKWYAYQVIVTKNADKMFYRDCAYDPYQHNPTSLGDGFAFNARCPWVGPYSVVDSRYGGGLLENATTIYTRPAGNAPEQDVTSTYQVADSLAGLDNSLGRSYNSNELNSFSYTFNDSRPGTKTLFVKFTTTKGKSEVKQASIEYNPGPVSEPVTSPSSSPIIPTGSVLDDFNRTNSTDTLGANWIVTKGKFGIKNGQAYVSSGCPAPGYAIADMGSNTGVYQVTLAKTQQDARLVFSYMDDQNLAWVEVSGFGYQLRKMENGNTINIAESNRISKDGDKIVITKVNEGNRVVVTVNGEKMFENAVSLFAPKVGFGTWCNNDLLRFDDFSFTPTANSGR